MACDDPVRQMEDTGSLEKLLVSWFTRKHVALRGLVEQGSCIRVFLLASGVCLTCNQLCNECVNASDPCWDVASGGTEPRFSDSPCNLSCVPLTTHCFRLGLSSPWVKHCSQT